MMTTLEIYQNALVALLMDRNVNCKLRNKGQELMIPDYVKKYDDAIKEIDGKIDWLKGEITKLQEEV